MPDGTSLSEVLEGIKRSFGETPRPAEALYKTPETTTAPAITTTLSVTLTPEQKEKIKEVLEKIIEIEAKGVKKAGEMISKLIDKYRKEKQLAEATGQQVDIEKVFKEAGIPVKSELGVYQL
jgi:outer membrane PBP1 activator LpoA protein